MSKFFFLMNLLLFKRLPLRHLMSSLASESNYAHTKNLDNQFNLYKRSINRSAYLRSEQFFLGLHLQLNESPLLGVNHGIGVRSRRRSSQIHKSKTRLKEILIQRKERKSKNGLNLFSFVYDMNTFWEQKVKRIDFVLAVKFILL